MEKKKNLFKNKKGQKIDRGLRSGRNGQGKKQPTKSKRKPKENPLLYTAPEGSKNFNVLSQNLNKKYISPDKYTPIREKEKNRTNVRFRGW